MTTAKGLVFVVEDNNDVRNVVTIYLRRNGYAVAEAAEGISALETLERIHPDVILLDVLLPKLDGIGVLKAIRENEATMHTPVVMMSAVLQTRDLKSETAKLNVSSFVQKPFQMRTLLEHVERALSLSSKSDLPPSSHVPKEDYHQNEIRLQMERVPMSLSGRLERTPVPELLHSIFVEFKTGRLQICSGTAEKMVFFQNGMPVYAESSISEETLGAHMLRKEIISEEEHNKAVEVMTESGRHFGEVLLKMGLIGPHDLFTELEAHLTSKVVSVFGWHQGTYHFEEGSDWKDEVIVARMKPGRILLAGVQQYWSPALVQKRLRITDLSRTFPLNDSPYSDDQLRLTTQEMRVEQLVKRGVIVGEIVSETQDLDFCIATLYALYVMEHVGFILPAEENPGAKRSNRVSRDDPTAAEKAELSKTLLAEYIKYRTADYFKLLGVGRGASTKEVEYAFRKRQKRYHPDSLLGIDSGLVHEKIEELYVRIHDAYRVLIDAELRREYIKSIDKKADGTPGELRSKTKRFSSMRALEEHVLVFEEGYSLLRAGDYDHAQTSFAQAYEMNPLDKYAAYRVWSAFLADPEKEKKNAEETLSGLIKKNEEDALYPYLLGNVAVKLNKTRKAIALFERALRLDQGHIDSARQLRLLRMRTRSTETTGLLDRFLKD